jgi:hypothetical protein
MVRDPGQRERSSAASSGTASSNACAIEEFSPARASKPRCRAVHWPASYSKKAASRYMQGAAKRYVAPRWLGVLTTNSNHRKPTIKPLLSMRLCERITEAGYLSLAMTCLQGKSC